MSDRAWRRAASAAAGVLLLATGTTATAPAVLAAPAAAEPRAFFPTDALTVADPRQATGRRIDLPTDGCAGPEACGLVRRLSQLDGFDLDPRIAVRFSRDVDPVQVAEQLVLEDEDGDRTGVERVVYDPETFTVFAHPEVLLAPATTYRLGLEQGGAGTTFTTTSAPDGLLDLQRQIDSGEAFRAVGIRRPGLRVEGVFPVGGADGAVVTGLPDRAPEPDRVPVATAQLPEGSRMVVGSFRAPTWLQRDVTIRQTPTAGPGPLPITAERLPFVAVLPPGPVPEGGWPVTVFGHGYTASADDVGLAATVNATRGIATIATDVVGHGSGPRSAWEFVSGGSTTVLPAYGRGEDQDGDGLIEDGEGSMATGAASAVWFRDALRQTTADLMTLVRSLDGTDVDGDGAPDLSGEDVTYAGQSFGGIYGAMLAGVDPAVTRAVLNVPGASVLEIFRLAEVFRPVVGRLLADVGLLDDDAAARGALDEQLPGRGRPPGTADPEALRVQEHLSRIAWLNRSGSPETFAPLLEPGRVLVQVAQGDRVVPNPTAHTLVDAGGLEERTVLFRTDRTPLAGLDPHAFLLDRGPFWVPGIQALAQAATFLTEGRVVDPDAEGEAWEVPMADPAILLPDD